MNEMLVYLDSNVLIAICDGHSEDLRLHLERTLGRGQCVYPFSAEQVSEITTSEESPQNVRRLAYLGNISRNRYFVHSIDELGFRLEAPEVVHKTINEVSLTFDPERDFANLITHDQHRQARAALGLDPSRLNNLTGREAVKAIDQALTSLVPEGVNAPRSMHELMEITKGFVSDSLRDQRIRLGQAEDSTLRSYQVIALFSMLDSFGYWPDDSGTYKKGSRFPDSRHTFNASYFDVLVSDDKRMRNRAQAVYEVLGIATQVWPPGELRRLAE